jgi:hypothetical protein
MVTREGARRVLSAFAFYAVPLGITVCGGRVPRSHDTVAPVQQAALPEAQNNDPLVWTWYYGQTPQQVQDLLGVDNRLVSIQVQRASPLVLNVAMVRNTGSSRTTWWWVPGTGPDVTGPELGGYAGRHEGRVVSLAPYVVDGVTHFAAVLIGNTGPDDKGWWWYFDTPGASIGALVSQSGARLVDLRSYLKNEATVYAFVMIANTGADESESWWYAGANAAAIRTHLNDNKAVLSSVQPADVAGATFDVIMNARGTSTMPAFQGVSWMWATNDTD